MALAAVSASSALSAKPVATYKGNINADGLPKDRAELKGKLWRFMQKLRKLPARIASYFKHKYIEYAAAPEPIPI
jgi:hypothetical protein